MENPGSDGCSVNAGWGRHLACIGRVPKGRPVWVGPLIGINRVVPIAGRLEEAGHWVMPLGFTYLFISAIS